MQNILKFIYTCDAHASIGMYCARIQTQIRWRNNKKKSLDATKNYSSSQNREWNSVMVEWMWKFNANEQMNDCFLQCIATYNNFNRTYRCWFFAALKYQHFNFEWDSSNWVCRF